MSVSKGHTLAALMPIATIPKGLTTVHVNLDSLGVEETARVSVTVENIEQMRWFFNLELSDKTKTTFTILRTISKGGLPNFCWLLVLLYIYIYIYIFFLVR